MEKFNLNVFYEICKFITFRDMLMFKLTSKKIMAKAQDAIIILSEREANRVLLASDNITRNLFVSKEKPKELLTNQSWFDFLVEQLKKRAQIKHNLYHVIPSLFPDLEKPAIVKLTTFMFLEVKRKRKMDISMKKSLKHSGISFTPFQELVSVHSKGMLSDRYPRILETSKPNYDPEEIINNNEVEIFMAFREYKNNNANCPSEPKSTVLAYLYLVFEFLECHCKTVAKSIRSKCNNETFLDEYNARWQSYVSLIEIFETELYFLADIVNQLSEDECLGRFYEDESEKPAIKFSLMRMMARAWAKYVMKDLFDLFKVKVTCILQTYQAQLLKVAETYEKDSKQKGADLRVRKKCELEDISYDVLKQALLSILDMSVNEYNVKMLNNSLLPLDAFY